MLKISWFSCWVQRIKQKVFSNSDRKIKFSINRKFRWASEFPTAFNPRRQGSNTHKVLKKKVISVLSRSISIRSIEYHTQSSWCSDVPTTLRHSQMWRNSEYGIHKPTYQWNKIRMTTLWLKNSTQCQETMKKSTKFWGKERMIWKFYSQLKCPFDYSFILVYLFLFYFLCLCTAPWV